MSVQNHKPVARVTVQHHKASLLKANSGPEVLIILSSSHTQINTYFADLLRQNVPSVLI